jgi:hypothetical protein
MQLAPSADRQFAADQSGFFTAFSIEPLRQIDVNKARPVESIGVFA